LADSRDCHSKAVSSHWQGLRFARLQTALSWLLSRVLSLPFLLLVAGVLPARADEKAVISHFRKDIQPLLKEYCYDCHGDGANKGKVAFDGFSSEDELVGRSELWVAVLKNLRAGLMPPEKKPRPSAEELQSIEHWIKRDALALDPEHPDPGRVTVRRLNRVEYRNTIRDLTGFDYKVEEELPPDDTGYGFDTIGDVLSVSPLLLEKYMQAAETITGGAVPRVGRVVAERILPAGAFRLLADTKAREASRFSFYEPAALEHVARVELPGRYRVVVEVEVLGEFSFDPGRCRLQLRLDQEQRLQQEFAWQSNKRFTLPVDVEWTGGEHRLNLELTPLTPKEKKTNSLDLRLLQVRIQGPQEEEHWVRPKNFELFFTQDPPSDPASRRAYATETLRRFASRAYRRPVDQRTVERLLTLAETVWRQPDKEFEDGIAQAIVPVLASPRFLFRLEQSQEQGPRSAGAQTTGANGSSASPRTSAPASRPLDEYSLASRLSYFLWSTMPDAELMGLAERGELRRQQQAQVRRMLADPRAQALVESFVGQWLQTRDVDGIDINARVVLARDAGEERQIQRMRQQFLEEREKELADKKKVFAPAEQAEREKRRERRRQFFQGRLRAELDRDLRRAMRQETEMLFDYIVREDRSVREFLESNYTFLNERLARHYGLTNLNINGSEMRRVELPEDSARGGVLTHGSVLVVTSNPTRTSPVKRGLFLLDNILGLPPPPPPADIPQLEESEKAFGDREPTLREVLAVHREKPLCSSCHNRMDPLGLALENFNALGLWREKERGQPIDPASRLVTGEAFRDVRELKQILAGRHATDFYRCLTEKMLTYALGRGLEHTDLDTVDRIVAQLAQENGRMSVLLNGIIESAPFQRRREPGSPVPAAVPAQEANAPSRRPAESSTLLSP
jgi:hypothetical protein